MDPTNVVENAPTSEELYLKRLASAERSYRQLIIACGAVMAVAIVIAVMFELFLGVALAFFCAGVYVYFSSEDIFKQLGLRYTHERGSLHIKRAVAKYGNTLYIPSQLIRADVTHIEDGALSSPKNGELRSVYIPKSIIFIGKDIFGEHLASVEVYYEGSEDEFFAIEGTRTLVFGSIYFNCPMPTLPPKTPKNKKQKNDQPADNDKEAVE